MRTLVQRWNGKKWVILRTPKTSDGGFDAVSCTTSSACTAVGFGGGHGHALVERWNGRKWTIERAVKPRAARNSELLSVSCTTARACVAVGDYTDKSGRELTLAERWNGSKWILLTTPKNPGGRTRSALAGVSCVKHGACAAVGSYNIGAASERALAESWNGKRWVIQHTPSPSTGANALSAVSCINTHRCTAVGNYTSGKSQLTLAMAFS
jgi:hypothetical protein